MNETKDHPEPLPASTPPATKPYQMCGYLYVEQTIEAPDARDAIARFRQVTGAEPEYVGKRLIVGYDEGDGKPILENDEYITDTEGNHTLIEPNHGLGEDDPLPHATTEENENAE